MSVETTNSEAADAWRWPMLAVMFLANALPEFLWSNLPPVVSEVVERYHVGPTMAGMTMLGFSVGTIAATRWAGTIIDKMGYRIAVLIGLAMCTAAASLRMVDGPFWLLVLAQAGIGASLPFTTATTSSFVVDCFEPRLESRMTAVCMVGLYTGLGVSMIVSPILWRHVGFPGLMKVTALISALTLVVSYPIARARRAPQQMQGSHRDRAGLRWVFSNRSLAILLATSLLAQGVFSGVAGCLELVWHDRGFSPEDAGLANGLFILGGTVGSLILSAIQDRFGHGRLLLILCYLAAILLTFPLFAAKTLLMGAAVATALGVCWLGNVPVSLTLLERSVGPRYAGIGSSYYWGFGNFGVIVLVPLFSALLEFRGWYWSVGAMILLMGLCLGVTFALPAEGETRHAVVAES
jgi:MFS transporter, AAHS family, 4-hydroxybenzoate transporter